MRAGEGRRRRQRPTARPRRPRRPRSAPETAVPEAATSPEIATSATSSTPAGRAETAAPGKAPAGSTRSPALDAARRRGRGPDALLFLGVRPARRDTVWCRPTSPRAATSDAARDARHGRRPPPAAGRGDRATTRDVLRLADAGVGRVVAALEAAAMYATSVVVVVSDNGVAEQRRLELEGGAEVHALGGWRRVPAFVHSPPSPTLPRARRATCSSTRRTGCRRCSSGCSAAARAARPGGARPRPVECARRVSRTRARPVLISEAHHAAAPAYETMWRRLRVGKYKILTNTPWCPSVAPSEGALSGMAATRGAAGCRRRRTRPSTTSARRCPACSRRSRPSSPRTTSSSAATRAAACAELKDAKAAPAVADGELASRHARRTTPSGPGRPPRSRVLGARARARERTPPASVCSRSPRAVFIGPRAPRGGSCVSLRVLPCAPPPPVRARAPSLKRCGRAPAARCRAPSGRATRASTP